MGLHVAVGIPAAVASAGMANLDEANAAFREPAREQQLLSELLGVPIVEAVQRADVGGLRCEVYRFGCRHLHAGGQFVGPGAGLDARLQRVPCPKLGIHGLQKFHLPVAFAGGEAFGRMQVGHRCGARLEWGGRDAGTEVSAGELHR